MAQVVEPHGRETRLFQNTSEGPIQQVLWLDRPAQAVTEDECIAASDQAHREPFRELPLLVTAQRSNGRRRQSDVTAALGALGLALHKASTPHPSDRAPYLKHPLLQVDVLPLQAEKLALAHPRGEREDVEGLEAIISSSQEKAARFLGVEGTHLVRCYPRRVHRIGHVDRDQAPTERLTECSMKYSVDVTHRTRRQSLCKL